MANMNETALFDAVRTILDDVVYSEWNQNEQPGLATARTASIFKPRSWDRAVYQEEVYTGLPVTSAVAEFQTVSSNAPSLSSLFSTKIGSFADAVDLSKEMIQDAMHGIVPETVEEMARKARVRQDINAMAIMNLGSTSYLTADGLPLFSAAHTVLGGTQSNLFTGGTSALSNDAINNGMALLQTMKDTAGVVMGTRPTWILVPPALYQKAVQLTNSVLVGDASTNAVNVWSSVYQLAVYQSPYLSLTAGGSDTAWYMGGDNHVITRLVSQDIQTTFREPKYSDNRSARYGLDFREAVKASTYRGVVKFAGV